MRSRFSAQQLFILRNHVPIDMLVESVLMVPTHKSHGTLRFACPLCSQFNTAINAPHNLAQCFDCRQNFNTIDMVMRYAKLDFVQSVKLLQKCYDQLPQPKTHPHSNIANIYKHHDEKGVSPPRKNCKTAVSIGKILPTILPDQPTDPQSKTDRCLPCHRKLTRRIVELEKKIDSFAIQLEKIQAIVNSQ